MGVQLKDHDWYATPTCNECGIALCWDLEIEQYYKHKDFWDDWICKTCNGDEEFNLQFWKTKNNIDHVTQLTPLFINDKDIHMIDQLDRLKHQYESVFWLAARDIIIFSSYNDETQDYEPGKTFPNILCNDTFYYASADAESLPLESAPFVKHLFERFDWSGVIAWCALRRGKEPLVELINDSYLEAKQYILDYIIDNSEPAMYNLLKEFFHYMDIEEETGSGRLFKPNYISSCRVRDGEKLTDILNQLKQKL